MTVETIIFDMDGTLLPSEHNYFPAQCDCAKIIALDLAENSPDPVTLINTADDIRKDLMRREGPVSNMVFPQSWIVLYYDLCNNLGREPNIAIEGALAVAASTYFREKYTLYPGVPEMMAELQRRGIRRMLATLGNQEVQSYKIQSADLAQYMHVMEILDNKRTEDYQAILKKYNLNPETTIMVGDNDKLDIQPAIDCGMRAFHIARPHHPTKIDTSQPLYTAIKSVHEILNYV